MAQLSLFFVRSHDFFARTRGVRLHPPAFSVRVSSPHPDPFSPARLLLDVSRSFCVVIRPAGRVALPVAMRNSCVHAKNCVRTALGPRSSVRQVTPCNVFVF